MTVRLEFDSEHLTVTEDTGEAAIGASLFELADTMGIQVPTSCKKNGKCRECLVEVTKGMQHLTPRTEEESHLTGKFRLSCRTRIIPSISNEKRKVKCHTLKRQEMRIEVEGRNLPHSFRDIAPTAIAESSAQGSASGFFGVALDVGTTTIVLRLIDLETGKELALRAFENPQRFGGSNIMSRIQFDIDNKGRLLQRTLLGYLTRALQSLPVDLSQIHEVVVAGNPTMRDLLFGLDVSSIGQKPFQSITELDVAAGRRKTTSMETTARKLRLPIYPDARVWSLPLLGCHVGADTAAGLLAIDIENRTEPFMFMDIGTNTEIICGTRDRLLIASCPAGPAFEGGSIDCGMAGLAGAIESVSFTSDGVPEYRVIGDGDPEGICGSGLIDLLSELRRTGMMDPMGRLENGQDRFTLSENPHIYLSESDISELAQAKGANQAGAQILLNQLGLEPGDLDRLYLAGGFAGHLDVGAARQIGLIPDVRDERIVQVGNASLEGASIALVSAPFRSVVDRFMPRIEHIQLEKDPDFFEFYADGCVF